MSKRRERHTWGGDWCGKRGRYDSEEKGESQAHGGGDACLAMRFRIVGRWPGIFMIEDSIWFL
jgi:hypothetical protein